MAVRFLFFALLFPLFIYAQENQDFGKPGKPSQRELEMTVYDKDPNADAVVLYEVGMCKFENINNRIRLVKTVYRKIKILTDKGKTYSNGIISLYGNKNTKEKISRFKALTINNGSTMYIPDDKIFVVDVGDNRSEVRFTFPNVQKGSIIELFYTIESPFYFNLSGWTFQSNIPTILSEFKAEIPYNFRYNRTIIADREKKKYGTRLKKNCFYPTSRSRVVADCEEILITMGDIPAFKEEDYMLSPKNYITRIDFQLRQVTQLNGEVDHYTKDWKTVDKEFRSDKNTGKQARKNNYFKNRLPEHITNIANTTERAKAVYTFIQNHYTWNGNYGFFQDTDVKEAFEKKSGSVSEINLSLINALNVANIDADMALLSTRQNGTPTKMYAVMTDFNYIAAHINIDGQSIFLDATDKQVPFGIVPFRCLNFGARVMDFKKGSYWKAIPIETKNMTYINTKIHVDESGNLVGRMRETNTGYKAISKRKEIGNSNNEEYLRNKKASFFNLEISSYKLTDIEDINKPVTEDYEFTINNTSNLWVFNPFIVPNYTQNPFQLDERTYPVDFGYPTKFTYLLSLDLAGYYTLSELPENKAIKFPENAGEASVVYSLNGNTLQMRFNFELNEIHFEPHNYQALKSFFNMVVEVQNNTPLVLKKVE